MPSRSSASLSVALSSRAARATPESDSGCVVIVEPVASVDRIHAKPWHGTTALPLSANELCWMRRKCLRASIDPPQQAERNDAGHYGTPSNYTKIHPLENDAAEVRANGEG